MRCPRCENEVAAAVASCPRCAAPLRFGDEPPPSALDGELRLDRRGRSRGGAREARREARPDAGLDLDLDLDRALGRSLPDSAEAGQLLGPRLDLDLAREAAPELDLGQDPILDLDPGRVPGGELDRIQEAEAGPLEIHLERAPALRRLAAGAVDAATLAAFAALPLGLAARGLPPGADLLALAPAALGLVVALAFAHAVVGHALLGATLGKRLLGLRVAGPDGAPPSLARSAVRALVALAGAVPLGLGPAVGLFTRSGQALHDLAARTVVVRAP